MTKRGRGRIAASYAPEFIAALRHYYVDTDKPVREIVVEFGITVGKLNRIVRSEGWPMRKDRPPRELPAAVKALEDARAIAENSLHLSHGERHTLGLDPSVGAARIKSGPGFSAPGEGLWPNESPKPPHPNPFPDSPSKTGVNALMPEQGKNEDAIARIEALVLAEIDAEEAARRQLGGAPRMAREAEKATRRLAILTQTLHTLHRLRAPIISDHADDDMPADIDEFRRELARRIDAFVASRTEQASAGSDPAATALDAAR